MKIVWQWLLYTEIINRETQRIQFRNTSCFHRLQKGFRQSKYVPVNNYIKRSQGSQLTNILQATYNIYKNTQIAVKINQNISEHTQVCMCVCVCVYRPIYIYINAVISK
jgi:hypothetical protein